MKKIALFFFCILAIISVQAQTTDDIMNKLFTTIFFKGEKIKSYIVKTDTLLNYVKEETDKNKIKESLDIATNYLSKNNMIFVAVCKEGQAETFAQFYKNLSMAKDKTQNTLSKVEYQNISPNIILVIKEYTIQEKIYKVYVCFATYKNVFFELIVTSEKENSPYSIEDFKNFFETLQTIF
ncbi:MAG TPA: hypothetical protein P5543_10185 [Planctomycetota bacterium]|nr:hypothetical protein [Planctomycetota bacterium]HRU52549.1 hypothetical protein [Planctomycetota bacterium]